MILVLVIGARVCIGWGRTRTPDSQRNAERYRSGNYSGVISAEDSINTLVQNITNPLDFLKMYATEKGFDTPLYTRSQASNPYMQDRAPITKEEYDRFKAVYEMELIPYM